VDKHWLTNMFEECGLTPEQAEQAANACLTRLLKRERPGIAVHRRSLVEHLIRDPLVSMNRILGRGDSGLPFVEDDSGELSPPAFASMLSDAGLDPVVSMAFAKVVAEAYTPEDLYQPIWNGLGHEGKVDFDALRREDWSPVRTHFADLLPPDLRATVQVPAQKPRARPPEGTKKAPTSDDS
jgi:hypothetical protein